MGGGACAKIIMNGLRSMATIEEIVNAAMLAREKGEYLGNDEQIVELLNEIENVSDKAGRVYLEGQGFTGPWPDSMTDKEPK